MVDLKLLISKPYGTQVVENVKILRPRIERERFSHIFQNGWTVSSLFPWMLTRQGHDYWAEIDRNCYE